MSETKRVALELSTDKNHPTGSIIVKDGKIIGIGANQSAIKNKFLLNLHKNYICIRKILKIKSGEKYWLCPGCASSRMHAEPRSISNAKKKGIDTVGSDMYHWGHWWCCKPCWDAMIDAGIKDVYLVDTAEEQFKK